MKLTASYQQSIRFLWGYMRLHQAQLIKIFAAVILTASTILSIGYVLRQFVDQGVLMTMSLSIWNPLILLVLFSIVISGSAYVRTSASAWLGETVASQVKTDFLHHVLYLPQYFFESARLGDLLSRFQSDINQIRNFISASSAVVMRSTLQLLGGSILLIIASPRLTFLVFALIPIVIIPIILLGKKVQRLTKLTQDLDGQGAALIEENLSAMATVKAFTNERYCEDEFATIIQARNAIIKVRTHYRSLLISLIIALVFLSVSIVLWIGLQQVQTGTLSMGQLSSFIFYAILVAGSVNNLIDRLEECSTALVSTERLTEIFGLPQESRSSNNPSKLIDKNPQTIEFKNITFNYPQRKEGSTLSHLSFSVAPLQKIALVGPSGAGKSTIFKLLLRLYDPQDGQILLNNEPTTRLSLEEVRSHFSLVPQDPIMFNASLLDNIRFGNPNAANKDILAAASAAYVDEFAKQLPQGYDTLVGEKGIRLSGGQKQRIALARAIIHNAPIFLLDEATNALDSHSEMIVQQALSHILKNKTAIIIAHRLATVQQADLILVLDQGHLVAHGTHKQLLKSSPLYKTLAETQLIAVLPEVS
jgi:ATP-binding cassette subfamily B protein